MSSDDPRCDLNGDYYKFKYLLPSITKLSHEIITPHIVDFESKNVNNDPKVYEGAGNPEVMADEYVGNQGQTLSQGQETAPNDIHKTNKLGLGEGDEIVDKTAIEYEPNVDAVDPEVIDFKSKNVNNDPKVYDGADNLDIMADEYGGQVQGHKSKPNGINFNDPKTFKPKLGEGDEYVDKTAIENEPGVDAIDPEVIDFKRKKITNNPKVYEGDNEFRGGNHLLSLIHDI